MISRGMIFNSFSIIYGVYKFSKKTGKFLNVKFFIKTITVCSLLFYLSVILVNEIRAEYFYTGKSRIDVLSTSSIGIMASISIPLISPFSSTWREPVFVGIIFA